MADTQNYKNQVFIPTVAEFRGDIARSWEIQGPLVEGGYCPGFMLLVRKDDEGKPRVFDGDHIQRMYEGVIPYSDRYGDAPIVTMLSNLPIGHIDFLHNNQLATDHVVFGIELARGLPIGGRKILTFHTNTLVTPSEFGARTRDEWCDVFDRELMPSFREIGKAATANNVDLLVESVPVPEFEDISRSDSGKVYRGVHWSQLRNPFYLYGHNYVRTQLRKAGLEMCLDICHNYTIIQAAADRDRRLLFAEDISYINDGCWDVLADVSSVGPLKLIHLNDGKGKYTHEGGVYEEGIALGEGDIPDMPRIVRQINNGRIPFVLEVNVGKTEGKDDFANRPWVVRSIEYLLEMEKSA